MEGRVRDGRKNQRWKEESEIEGKKSQEESEMEGRVRDGRKSREESELQSSSMQVPIQLWKSYTCSACASLPQVYVWNTHLLNRESPTPLT